ncbi:MAG: CotH kinase family protein [Chitinophagales bacterium]|nr:CotH kinase family protein [Chitinophagales bacterium]
MKKNTLLLFTLCFVTFSAFSQVVINEYSAANRSIITDNFGEYEDWIELYNTSSMTIDLSGYHLSDRISNPDKWAFPAGASIAPNGRLLVWASGRNTSTGNTHHTNFKLTQTANNEAVVFADPSGVIIDSYVFSPTQTNHSHARQTDGNMVWGIDTSPSPNATNNTTGSFFTAYTPTPDIEPSSGGYASTTSITITCSDPTATIYYTTNGNFPTTAATLYTAPFDVSSTSVVHAIAVSADGNILSSFMETNTYFINETFTMPVVSISGTQVDELLEGDYNATPIGSFEWFDANLQLQDETVGEYNKHGNDSWAYAQRGFDYITRDELGYDSDVDETIFSTTDRNSFQRLIFKAAANDNYPFQTGGAHIRDAFVHHLSQVGNLELDERAYEPCVVFMNGEYWGLYDVREKTDDSDFTDYYYDKEGNEIDYIQTWGGTWNAYGDMNDWNALRNYVLSNDMSNDANYQYVTERLNPLSLIDYIIINSHTVCSDWLNYNTSWWHSNDNEVRWRYVLWDMDATFDHYINYTGVPSTSPNAAPCGVESPGVDDPEQHINIFERLYENEQFRSLYINRYADLNNTVFSCDYMLGILDQLIDRIEPEMPKQVARWGGTMNGWQNNVQQLRDFITARCAAIDAGIIDCYDVEGPFPLTVSVEPPLSGDVTLNTLDLSNYSYPFTGDYFANTTISLAATPATNWVFSYWEVDNHIILADSLSNPANFLMTTGDNIVAHFMPLNPTTLTVILDTPAGGEILLNGTTISTSPTTLQLNANTAISLSALPDFGYNFLSWELSNHTILPNNTSTNANFVLTQNDTLVVHFAPIVYTIVYMVEPAGAGQINLNNSNISNYPNSVDYNINTPINMAAIPAAGFEFVSWELQNNILFPSQTDSAVVFNTTAPDTIIAHFNALPIPTYTITIVTENGGTVTANNSAASPSPYVFTIPQGSNLDLAALAAEGFSFEGWNIVGQILADTSTNNLSFVPTADLQITANFDEIITYTITLLLNSTEGSLTANGGTITTSPYTIVLTEGESLDLAALAGEGFVFGHWEGNNWVGIDTQQPTISFVPTANDTIQVFFVQQTVRAILIPTAFSPNGDDVNDLFRIAGNDATAAEIHIYDRWGREVFASSNISEGWDGKNKGIDLPIGAYSYFAKITNSTNETIERKGFVVLMR